MTEAERMKELVRGLEGGLFVSVFIIQVRGMVMICQDRYTVLDGDVYEIKNGRTSATRDNVYEMFSLDRIGNYDPTETYVDIEAIPMERPTFIKVVEAGFNQ